MCVVSDGSVKLKDKRKEDSKKAQNNEGYWRNYLIIVGVISGNLMLVLGFESRWLVRF